MTEYFRRPQDDAATALRRLEHDLTEQAAAAFEPRDEAVDEAGTVQRQGVTVAGAEGIITLEASPTPPPVDVEAVVRVDAAGQAYADVAWLVDPEEYGADSLVGFEILTLATGATVTESFPTPTGSPTSVPLQPSTEYTIWLIAYDRLGETSVASNAVVVTTPAAPPPPPPDPPAASPAATILGGMGFLFAKWDAVAGEAVTYEVHLSTADGFVPSAATLYAETDGTFAFIKSTVGGAPLAYGTTYRVRIVAKNAGGAAPAGAQAAGSMVQASGPDIAAATIVAGSAIIADSAILEAKIADLAVTAAKIADLTVTAAKIANATISTAKIADLAVTNAKIANATISDAKIASLSATKITTGSLTAAVVTVSTGGSLRSGNFVSGAGGSGWRLSDTLAELNDVTVRGVLDTRGGALGSGIVVTGDDINFYLSGVSARTAYIDTSDVSVRMASVGTGTSLLSLSGYDGNGISLQTDTGRIDIISTKTSDSVGLPDGIRLISMTFGVEVWGELRAGDGLQIGWDGTRVREKVRKTFDYNPGNAPNGAVTVFFIPEATIGAGPVSANDGVVYHRGLQGPLSFQGVSTTAGGVNLRARNDSGAAFDQSSTVFELTIEKAPL